MKEECKQEEQRIMLIMLRLYKENRIAVVDECDGELKTFQFREYVDYVKDRY